MDLLDGDTWKSQRINSNEDKGALSFTHAGPGGGEPLDEAKSRVSTIELVSGENRCATLVKTREEAL